MPPEALPELMSLTGDPIDNIPGVPGVGEKTASALIQEFGTVENLLSSIDRVKRPKLREALKAHVTQVRTNRTLVTLRTGLPVCISPQTFRRRLPDGARLRALFEELGFLRLLNNLREAEQGNP